VVFVLMWVLRKLQWPVEGIKALWLTMGVSVVIAVVETLISSGSPGILVCSLSNDPEAALACVIEIAEAVVEQAAIVFAASQLVYQVLRRALVGERV